MGKMKTLNNDLFFKGIVELSDRPIIVSSIEGKYIYTNKCYLEIREKTEASLKGKYWWKTFDNEELGIKIKKHLSEIVRNGEKNYSAEYITGKNKTHYIEWNVMIVNNDELGGKLILEYGKDVTEQMALKSQLIHMQKLDSLGSLAGGIAHEFNNILTSIIGYSSFLKNLFKKYSKERDYVDKIQRASLRAAKLTSKLLGFARKGKYFEKLIDPNTVVQEVFDIIKQTINKKIKVDINLISEKRFILADYDQIFQSIMNLVINASDAMECGGVLTLSTGIMTFSSDKEFIEDGFVVKKGDYYAISVKDTGIGMSDEIRKKIIEPFFTTKPEGKGTGLGVPMVYGVAKNHRGNLFIESELGKGTKMTLTIPLKEHKSIDAISEDSGIFPIIKVKDTKRIMIVDDDIQILEYLKTVLTEYGYIIDISSDSEEAYSKVISSHNHYDLILLDLILPKFDGEEFVEKLEKDIRDIKVVIMTSYPDDKKVEKLKLSGMNYFIFKPFKISNLINLLKNIFEDKEV